MSREAVIVSVARAQTTLESLGGLKPVREGGYVSAGNASQLSDGAAWC